MSKKETCILHDENEFYIKIREKYLNLCIYAVKSPKRELTIKRNDCAAALIAYYEHKHNSLLNLLKDGNSDKKDKFLNSSMSYVERGMAYLYSQNSIREANDMLERRGFITTRVRRNPDNPKQFLPTEVRFNPERVIECLALLEIEPTSKLNKVYYFKNEVPLLQFYREELSFINNPSLNNKEDSVVTDTPPLATDLSNREKLDNCEKEAENLENVKTETLQKKTNSGGGGGENSQSDVGNLNKPKKQPSQRLNLATLTDIQKNEINAVLSRYDDVNAAKLAWIEWLEHKSKAGGKIKQYKDHVTALKALELASKQAQFQSEALTDAVNNSIANEYQGIFPENFVKKSYQNGTTNSKTDRATANNDYMERLRRGEDLPYK